MLDIYSKDYVKDIKKEKIDEAFPSAEKALNIAKGPSTNLTFNKIMDAIGLTTSGADVTENVKKRLKKIGMEEDEINELRDVYVKVVKRALETISVKHYDHISSDNPFKLYKLNKKYFSLYELDPSDIYGMNDKYYKFVDELDKEIEKNFKIIYEKRLKNRMYGKIE